MHHRFVEADGKARACPGQADIRKNAPDTIEADGRRRAFIVAQHIADQRKRGEVGADQRSLVG